MTPLFANDALLREAKRRWEAAELGTADALEERDIRWLFFNGPQWGDEAPNRLFGAWLNQDGEAV